VGSHCKWSGVRVTATCHDCPGVVWDWDQGVSVSDCGGFRVPLWGLCPRGHGSTTSHLNPDGTPRRSRYRNYTSAQCEAGPVARPPACLLLLGGEVVS
jgi:hypothetical protein